MIIYSESILIFKAKDVIYFFSVHHKRYSSPFTVSLKAQLMFARGSCESRGAFPENCHWHIEGTPSDG